MTVQNQIKNYLAAQPEPKRSELRDLHEVVLKLIPGCRLWFLDGRDESGRTVSNPSIGYGTQTTQYADGRTKEFYQIGISANTTGISVYLMGLTDKKYLAEKYGKKIGQAKRDGLLHQVPEARERGRRRPRGCNAVRHQPDASLVSPSSASERSPDDIPHR